MRDLAAVGAHPLRELSPRPTPTTGTMALMLRRPLTWLIAGVIAAVGITLGVILSSGIGFADAAGERLDVPAVSIVPTPADEGTPTPTPTNDDEPDIVDGPPPVTVDLDDHGGDRDRGGDDNSRHGNSGDDD